MQSCPPSQNADLAPTEVISGSEFLTPETRALQADEFANPGHLWVEKGRAAFVRAPSGAASCNQCHTLDSLAATATRYPRVDPLQKRLVNLHGRINQCRVRHQQQPPLDYESVELLALTALVTGLSRDLPYDVQIDGQAASYFQQGREYFFRRKGQLNLACSQCHDERWGRLLRGDRISQGHPTAWPAYRFAWQSFGSLHRRFQDCDLGIRAQPLAAGSQAYISLELYLAWRSANLPMESPGVRR